MQRKNVELRGFGTFFVKEIKEKHSARNPKTGEMIYVPKKNKVRFRASKKLKEFLLFIIECFKISPYPQIISLFGRDFKNATSEITKSGCIKEPIKFFP